MRQSHTSITNSELLDLERASFFRLGAENHLGALPMPYRCSVLSQRLPGEGPWLGSIRLGICGVFILDFLFCEGIRQTSWVCFIPPFFSVSRVYPQTSWVLGFSGGFSQFVSLKMGKRKVTLKPKRGTQYVPNAVVCPLVFWS